MIVALTITKYKTHFIPFAFIGMAILRIPLWANRKCKFWRLMGSGKDAQVDLAPDYKHWAILTTWKDRIDCDQFYKKSVVIKWFRKFGAEEFTVILNPLVSHGLWAGKNVFETSQQNSGKSGRVAAITRATINWNRMNEFRANMKRAGSAMRTAPGFIMAAGVGENPFSSQATFSIWEDLESMKNYAYKTTDHSDVIKLTRTRKWYSEELFARFEILEITGSLNGKIV
ncbi:heme-degrading monooxygenase HmoA [Pedobacter sp. UYEF25]